MLNKFFKIKIIYNNHNKVVNKEDNFLLLIEIINIFKLVFLPPYYLKFKKNYIIILLKNLKSN